MLKLLTVLCHLLPQLSVLSLQVILFFLVLSVFSLENVEIFV